MIMQAFILGPKKNNSPWDETNTLATDKCKLCCHDVCILAVWDYAIQSITFACQLEVMLYILKVVCLLLRYLRAHPSNFLFHMYSNWSLMHLKKVCSTKRGTWNPIWITLKWKWRKTRIRLISTTSTGGIRSRRSARKISLELILGTSIKCFANQFGLIYQRSILNRT